jgi:lauroyl/myristoyl acyltransferase
MTLSRRDESVVEPTSTTFGRFDHKPAPAAGKATSGNRDSTSTSGEGPVTVQESGLPSLWERASFTVTHAVASAFLGVFGLGGLERLGRMFGTLEWLINHRRRRRFHRAYDKVLESSITPRQRRTACRDYFMRTRCDKLFYLIFDRVPRDTAHKLFSIRNQALLDESLANGRGVYLALSHHGAHHVAAMLAAVWGYKVAGVRDRTEGALRRFVQHRFDRHYPEFRRMRVIFADAYPRDIYRCFHEGYLLGSAMDVQRTRHATQKAEEFELFGERRPFVSGPLRVAIRCKAPVLQAFILAHDRFRYELVITGRLLDPDNIRVEDQAVREALAVYARTIEQYIRAYPSLMTRV